MSKIKSATKHAEEIGILLLHGREGVIESDESLFRHLIQHERGVQFDALEAAAEVCQQLKLKYMRPVDGIFNPGAALGANICEDEVRKLVETL